MALQFEQRRQERLVLGQAIRSAPAAVQANAGSLPPSDAHQSPSRSQVGVLPVFACSEVASLRFPALRNHPAIEGWKIGSKRAGWVSLAEEWR